MEFAGFNGARVMKKWIQEEFHYIMNKRDVGISDPDEERRIRQEFQIPEFNGRDVAEWILQVEDLFHFFLLNETQKLKVAILALDGDASRWFEWEHERRPFVCWKELKERVLYQFPPTISISWCSAQYGGDVATRPGVFGGGYVKEQNGEAYARSGAVGSRCGGGITTGGGVNEGKNGFVKGGSCLFDGGSFDGGMGGRIAGGRTKACGGRREFSFKNGGDGMVGHGGIARGVAAVGGKDMSGAVGSELIVQVTLDEDASSLEKNPEESIKGNMVKSNNKDNMVKDKQADHQFKEILGGPGILNPLSSFNDPLKPKFPKAQHLNQRKPLLEYPNHTISSHLSKPKADNPISSDEIRAKTTHPYLRPTTLIKIFNNYFSTLKFSSSPPFQSNILGPLSQPMPNITNLTVFFRTQLLGPLVPNEYDVHPKARECTINYFPS